MLRENDLHFPLGWAICLEPLPQANRHSAELAFVIFDSVTNGHQVGLGDRLIYLFPVKGAGPSASVSVQKGAFATGIPPDIYEFHLYTGNSPFLSRTQVG